MTNFSDRLFLVKLADTTEVGLYSVGVRIASAMVLLLTAFRLAWPAFAYSIEDEGEARRTYAFVLTYLVLVTTWVATGARAPLAVDRRLDRGARVRRVVARRRAARVRRRRVRRRTSSSRSASAARQRTQFNWVVTGAAAAVNVALNLILIPPYGMMGAAVATVAAYATMFAGMVLVGAAHLPGAVPVAARRSPRRSSGVALVAAGKLRDGGLHRGAPARARVSARARAARLLPSRGTPGDRRATTSRALAATARAPAMASPPIAAGTRRIMNGELPRSRRRSGTPGSTRRTRGSR